MSSKKLTREAALAALAKSNNIAGYSTNSFSGCVAYEDKTILHNLLSFIVTSDTKGFGKYLEEHSDLDTLTTFFNLIGTSQPLGYNKIGAQGRQIILSCLNIGAVIDNITTEHINIIINHSFHQEITKNINIILNLLAHKLLFGIKLTITNNRNMIILVHGMLERDDYLKFYTFIADLFKAFYIAGLDSRRLFRVREIDPAIIEKSPIFNNRIYGLYFDSKAEITDEHRRAILTLTSKLDKDMLIWALTDRRLNPDNQLLYKIIEQADAKTIERILDLKQADQSIIDWSAEIWKIAKTRNCPKVLQVLCARPEIRALL